MKTVLIKTLIIFLGLFIWILIVFTMFSFLKLNINPFFWGENLRLAFLLITSCYLIFIPFILFELNDK